MILYWRVPVIQPGYLKTDMDHLMIRNNPVIGILTLMKLVEVLRAGDQFNLEEDVSYDQILFIVEQLVKDKQVKFF